MTRSERDVPATPVPAARWPILFIGSVVFVVVGVAVPFIVHNLLRDRIGSTGATWAAVGVGVALLVAISIAWVLLRARRHAREDLAHGFEPT